MRQEKGGSEVRGVRQMEEGGRWYRDCGGAKRCEIVKGMARKPAG